MPCVLALLMMLVLLTADFFLFETEFVFVAGTECISCGILISASELAPSCGNCSNTFLPAQRGLKQLD